MFNLANLVKGKRYSIEFDDSSKSIEVTFVHQIPEGEVFAGEFEFTFKDIGGIWSAEDLKPCIITEL